MGALVLRTGDWRRLGVRNGWMAGTISLSLNQDTQGQRARWEMRFTIDGRLDASRASSLGYTPGVDDNILAAVDYFFTPGVGRERFK